MEQRISIERLEQAINLFGSFDENIRLIESEFHVTVANREGELRVNGEPEDTMLACKALSNFICITENFSVNYGDMIILACACFFALHIITIERFSVLVDGVRMSLLQFAVCGILSLPAIFFYETPSWEALDQAWLPILYAGIMSCGIAYTLQILGQKYVNVILASIILSMESVFSVLAGWLLLGEQLSLREIGGCGLVFAAILLAQMPPKQQ